MIVTEAAHLLGVVPLIWLAVFGLAGERRDARFWWLAVAFAVSWVADLHWPKDLVPVIAAVYPVSQASLVGIALLDRRGATLFATVLLVVGSASVLWTGVLLDAVASFGIVVLAFERSDLGVLRWSVAALGLSFVVWWGYLIWPSTEAWLAYQGARLLATTVFCAACWRISPRRAVLARAR